MNRGLVQCLGLIALALTAPPGAAATIAMPSSTNIGHPPLPYSFNINVFASGFVDGAAPSIGAYELVVTYDASLFAFAAATFGDGLDFGPDGSLQDVTTPAAGHVALTEVALASRPIIDRDQPGDFLLMTLTFDLLTLPPLAGSRIDIDGEVVDAFASPLAVTYGGTVIRPVPLPAAAWLFASWLAISALAASKGAGYT